MFERGQESGKRAVKKSCAAKERICTAGAYWAWVAQLVERVLGKDEVTGSIPVPGSRLLGFTVRKSFERSGGNSTVESHSSKVMVAGSNPVPRSKVLRGRLGAPVYLERSEGRRRSGEVQSLL